MQQPSLNGDRYRLIDILRLARQSKVSLVLVIVSAVTLTLFYLSTYPSYMGQGYLVVDSQGDKASLQNLLGSLGANMESSSSQNDAEDTKLLMALDTHTFDELFISAVKSDPTYSSLRSSILKTTTPIDQIKIAMAKLSKKNPALIEEMSIPRGTPTTRKSGIIQIRLNASNREASVFLMNHYLNTAMRFLSAKNGRRVEEAKAYIEQKIEESVSKLGQTDTKIVTTTQKNWSLLSSRDVAADGLLKLQTDLQSAEIEKARNSQILLKFQNQDKERGDHAQNLYIGLNKTLNTLRKENQLLEIRIDTLKKGIAAYLKSNIALPKQGQVLADLKRQQELNFYVFDNLVKALLEIEVKGLAIQGSVQPLELISINQVKPTIGTLPAITVSMILSLLGSLILIAVRQLISPVVRSKDDITRSNVSNLGSLPMVKRENTFRTGGLINCRFDLETPETAAFRQIRSRLHHLARNSGTQARKVIGVLSYGHGEGKTFISYNLAACIAQTGAKTIVLDFDLRRGSLTNNLGMNNKNGVIDVIEGTTNLKGAIISQVEPNLDFLPMGNVKSNCIEKIKDTQYSKLIEALHNQYDYVVLDTAPLIVAHESLILSRLSDFSILVVSQWRSRLEYIEEALDRILEVKRSHIHFIINKTEDASKYLAHGYYYTMTKKSAAPVATMSNNYRKATNQSTLEH